MTKHELVFRDKGLGILVDALNEKASKDLKELENIIKDTGRQVSKDAQNYLTSNGNINTGKLHNSIKGQYSKLSNVGFKYTVSAGAKHAIFIEEGTRPHIIRARRKKVLMFYQDGKPVFTKEVFHPGTKESPFMSRALQDNAPCFIDSIEEVIEKWT